MALIRIRKRISRGGRGGRELEGTREKERIGKAKRDPLPHPHVTYPNNSSTEILYGYEKEELGKW